MITTSKIKILPPVCLLISLARLLTGKLRFSKSFLAGEVSGIDGQTYKIFRYILIYPQNEESGTHVFVVSFRFSHLSFRTNKLASVVPMLLIAGFPGFMQKIYAVDPLSGNWQGMYQWRSQKDLEAYQKSFVFRMMNKRAVKGSVTSLKLLNLNLNDYIKEQSEINNQ